MIYINKELDILLNTKIDYPMMYKFLGSLWVEEKIGLPAIQYKRDTVDIQQFDIEIADLENLWDQTMSMGVDREDTDWTFTYHDYVNFYDIYWIMEKPEVILERLNKLYELKAFI